MTQPYRHYLHGDIVDVSTDNPVAAEALRQHAGKKVVYCRRCDAFEPVEVVCAHPPEIHVKGHGTKNVQVPYDGQARYAAALKRWARRDRDTAAYRPANAPNIFA
jgi:hypothetical protein